MNKKEPQIKKEPIINFAQDEKFNSGKTFSTPSLSILNEKNQVLECKKRDEAEILYKNAVSIIDKLSQKKIIHSNTASRKKSSLSKFYNSL